MTARRNRSGDAATRRSTTGTPTGPHTEEVESFDGFADHLRQTLKERWGRDTFDFLVNNAGSGVAAPFAETSTAAATKEPR
jgi:NAD(P)-dependent dehydrogenase (short-subunit alcohol dehydrogenase family)